MSSERVFNFSPGPATLPLEVLQEVRDSLLNYEHTGMSIIEMSHRSKPYEQVHNQAQEDLRELMGIGDEYEILFMGGGARTQFALIPTNLLPKDGTAHYITTGTWSEGAIKEAQKLGDAVEIWTGKPNNYDRVPSHRDYNVVATSSYLHYTSNNTIYGTQYQNIPESGSAPLVCDMSSDILSRPVDVSKFGMIYAGAQKNMGPAGVTVVIIRKELLERSRDNLPEMWSYKKIAAKNSLLNTPPVFPIYVTGLVLKHLRSLGGLTKVAELNTQKASMIYDVIDSSSGFYKGHAQPDSRSQMNITFRLPNEELEKAFVEESTAGGLSGLKGHRSVGGIRASIYNAMPLAGAEALVSFMKDFQHKHG